MTVSTVASASELLGVARQICGANLLYPEETT